jgi:hypothetical protein
MLKIAAAILSGAILASCSTTDTGPVVRLKDGEQAVPADYKSWPKFLMNVQRGDAKQVRDIYINPVGARTQKGQTFPNGTIMVMENYAAKPGTDGKLAKGELLRVFVMGKGAGWGDSAPEGLKNGDWIYSGYMADGKTRSPEPFTACRSCHLPLAKADFVFRVDEYFATRDGGTYRGPAAGGY